MSKAVKTVTSSFGSSINNLSKGNIGAAYGDYLNGASAGLSNKLYGRTTEGTPDAEAAKAAMQGGVDESGRPVRPGFQTLLGVDSKTGLYNNYNLPTDLQAKMTVGDAGRTQLSNRAMATGPSDLAQLQLQNQGLNEQNALSDISKQGNSQLAQAQGSLARTGGLRSGVGAIMAQRNMQDQMMQNQQARRGGQQDRLSINMNDDNQKNSLLQSLVGQDANSQQFNTSNSIAEKRAKDTADMSAYAQDMQAWAAKQQGNAIARSAPQGGGMLSFLGL